MDLSQWFGLIILFFAMVFSIAKKLWEEFNRRRDPEKYERAKAEQERLLRQIFGDYGEEDEEIPSPSSKTPQQLMPESASSRQRQKKAESRGKFDFRSNLEDFEQHSRVEKRRLDLNIDRDHEKKWKQRSLVELGVSHSLAATVKHESSKGVQLLRRTPSLQDAFILKEIFEPPLALRDSQPWTSKTTTEESEKTSRS